MIDALTGFVVVGVAVFVGYVIARVDLLGQHARHVFSRLVFFVLSPILLFSVLSQADVALLFSALLPVSMLAAAVVLVISVAVAGFILRRPVGDVVIGALSAAQVNSNNIGIPLSLYMLGSAAYPAPVILFQLVILMPVALGILDAIARGSRSPRRILAQTLRNPMLIGSILGVVVALVDIELPPIVLDPITFLANACVPMMLISYGMSLFGQRVLTTRGRRIDVVLATSLKLLVMPVAAWLLALAFALPPEQVRIVVFLAALPTAQNVFNFAQRYDTGEIVARDTILLTTIGSLPVLLATIFLLS